MDVSAMDVRGVLEQIKALYFKATAKTIADDLMRAIELLKSLPDEETRERVAVYMDGLAQMRAEWHGGEDGPRRPKRGNTRAPRTQRTSANPAKPTGKS